MISKPPEIGTPSTPVAARVATRNRRRPPRTASVSATPAWDWQVVALLAGVLCLALRLNVFLRQREGGSFATVDSYALAQIIIVGSMGCIIALRPARLLGLWRKLSGSSGRVFLLFFGPALLSTAWSPMPSYSAYRGIEFLSQVLAVFLILAYASRLDSEKILLSVCVLVMLAGTFTEQAFTGGGLAALRGGNTLSACAAMTGCYALGEWFTAQGNRARILLLVTALGMGLLAIGNSLASLWSFLLGVAVASFFTKRRYILIPIIAVLCFIGYFGDSEGTRELLTMGRSAERLESMTGRRFLWEHYLEKFQEKPLLGHGYAVTSRLQGPIYTTNTHNSLLAALLGTGLVGGALVLCMVALLAKEFLRSAWKNHPGSVGVAGALTAGLANSMSVGFLFETWSVASLVFVMIYAYHLFGVDRQLVNATLADQPKINAGGRVRSRHRAASRQNRRVRRDFSAKSGVTQSPSAGS